MQTSVDESLDESIQLQKSLHECRPVQTNEDECKQIKRSSFDINEGFPRCMFFNLRRFLPQKNRQMKKSVLHCNRCTVVTPSFNLFFLVYKKEIPLERGCQAKHFLSEQANFSASGRLRINFPTVQNGPEKGKNLYLIKLVSK